MSEADLLELVLGGPAAGGSCVARTASGQVVFVRHGLPGEAVRARVTQRTRRFLRADAVEILQASPHRVEPPCPHAGPGRCGGCDWQHVDLPEQRRLKARLLQEALGRLAGLDVDVPVEEVPGAPGGLGWRTRVRFAVDPGGRLGFHRHRSDAIEAVERCLIAAPAVEALRLEARRWTGARAVEVAVGESGAAVTVRPGRGRLRPGPLTQVVRGRAFQVGAESFWQVHLGAAEALVEAVLRAADPQEGDVVADLYGGAGLFSAFLAERVGPFGRILVVEGDRGAAADALGNLACLSQAQVLRAAVTPDLIGRRGPFDRVVLDPPRAGAGLEVSAALAVSAERAIAYVSCDPASLARDLAVLLGRGWSLASLRAFDLFPMTEHVEVVAGLRRRDAAEADRL